VVRAGRIEALAPIEGFSPHVVTRLCDHRPEPLGAEHRRLLPLALSVSATAGTL